MRGNVGERVGEIVGKEVWEVKVSRVRNLGE